MDSLATSFKERAKEAGITLEEGQIEKFLLFLQELKDWNRKFNLTSIDDEEEILVKHFVDSLSCLSLVPLEAYGEARKVIDVGSGAGFPGIPLRIYRRELHLTLLEATGKKVEFLIHVSRKLGLETDLQIVHGRAEDYGKSAEHREKYDLAVSRAVSDLAVLAEYCLPFVRVGGIFISQKGRQIGDELKRARKAIEILGGRLRQVLPYRLLWRGQELERNLVVVDKVAKTPEEYPRRAGMPAKRPIR